MHSKSDNIQFMRYDNTNQVANEFFESLHSKNQSGLETSMRWSDFIFHSVQLLYYNSYKINFQSGRSYIDSPDKNEEATKIPKNEDDVFSMRQLLH